MSFVIAAPEVIAAAATDLASLESSIAAANTTALLAAGADEVSTAVAALFGAHGQAYQALSAQAQAFHAQFTQALTSGGGAYAAAEAAAVSPLLDPINEFFLANTGRPLIGNGANGAPGTGADGAPGGWLIGNGGAGGSGAAVLANPAQSVQQDLLAAVNAQSVALTGRPLIGNGANGA
ncbi:PE family protein, partial [Mycobacterium tuberculosis]|uniref:PE family protein n=1 Tax=Mycobacterium tuberculosis TaxID=1773 RepID=UPI001F296838